MNKSDLYANLFYAIGLTEDENHTVIDSDTNMPIMFHNNYITTDGRGRNEIIFDPLDNVKLCKSIFSYYLNKKSEETGCSFPVFYFDYSQNGFVITTVNILDMMGVNHKLSSRPYLNECTGYLDLVFLLENEDQYALLKKYDKKRK